MSGIGFAIGMERLLSLAQDDGHEFKDGQKLDAYVISLGSVGSAGLIAAEQLRNAGYTAEANLLPRSLKAQFKSADRGQAKYIVIIGEEELKNGMLNLKNSETKQQITIPMNDLISEIQKQEGK